MLSSRKVSGAIENIVSEWVIKFDSLSWTADSEVHVVQISYVIIAYILE